MGHPEITTIPYRPAAGEVVELKALVDIARHGGAPLTRPQRPEFDLILWIRSPRLAHEIDFRGFTLDPAGLIWVRAGQVQRWGDLTEIDGKALLFTGDTLPEPRPILIDAPNHWRDIRTRDPFVRATLDLFETAWASDSARIALPYLVTALTTYLTTTSTTAASTHPLYHQFVTVLEADFRRSRSVDHYCRILGYTAKTLNRATAAAVGASAKQVIDRRITLEAKRLLVHADTPVATIAEQLGFDDPANFSRYFRSQTGRTPREFRHDR